MFTGLIESVGEIADVTAIEGGFRLGIRTALSPELREGESVAVNGVCLTVVRAQAARGHRDRSGNDEGHEPWPIEARVARQSNGRCERTDALEATLCSATLTGPAPSSAFLLKRIFSGYRKLSRRVGSVVYHRGPWLSMGSA